MPHPVLYTPASNERYREETRVGLFPFIFTTFLDVCSEVNGLCAHEYLYDVAHVDPRVHMHVWK